MKVLFDKENTAAGSNGRPDTGAADIADEDEEAPKKKVLPWQRNVKKGKKAAANKKPNAARKTATKKTAEKQDDQPAAAAPKTLKTSKAETRTTKDDASDNSGSDEDVDDDDDRDAVEEDEPDKSAANDSSEPEKDDDQLERLQSDVALRRQRLLEGKSQVSHSVHCPLFPQDKQEYWWLYISDRKQQILLTTPYHVTNLVEHDEVQLKFTAPFKPGMYTFALCLRSDSYFGFDQMKDIKVSTTFNSHL